MNDVKRTLLAVAVIGLMIVAAGCGEKTPAPSQAPAPPATAPQAGEQAPVDHPPIEKSAGDATAPAAGSIAKTNDGTVADLYAKKDELAGKQVTLRGKVMKFSPMIMGKNWIHVQDGSGEASAGNNDMTVTTSQSANVGDTVLVKGTLVANKDFGAGYSYDVIVEDAEVTVEQ